MQLFIGTSNEQVLAQFFSSVLLTRIHKSNIHVEFCTQRSQQETKHRAHHGYCVQTRWKYNEADAKYPLRAECCLLQRLTHLSHYESLSLINVEITYIHRNILFFSKIIEVRDAQGCYWCLTNPT